MRRIRYTARLAARVNAGLNEVKRRGQSRAKRTLSLRSAFTAIITAPHFTLHFGAARSLRATFKNPLANTVYDRPGNAVRAGSIFAAFTSEQPPIGSLPSRTTRRARENPLRGFEAPTSGLGLGSATSSVIDRN